MLLYTIADATQIFPPPPGAALSYRSAPYGYVEGVLKNGSFTVSRLISTDPRAYLSARYHPGGRLI